MPLFAMSEIPPGAASESGPNTLALASMTTGILALVGSGCCCVPYVGMVGMCGYPITFALTIAAFVTGYFGYQESKRTGDSGAPMAMVGMAAAGVGLALVLLELAISGIGVVGLMLMAVLEN